MILGRLRFEQVDALSDAATHWMFDAGDNPDA